jgi:hypothetical protein
LAEVWVFLAQFLVPMAFVLLQWMAEVVALGEEQQRQRFYGSQAMLVNLFLLEKRSE